MTTSNHAHGACSGGPGCAHKVTVHWNDSERRAQQRRFAGGIEPQYCDEIAQAVWSQIKEQVAKLGPDVRVDVPLPRVISRVLGIYRAGATLKDNPMKLLELSIAEIAKIAGYSKAQVAAALRWFGLGVIRYKGKVVAHGLGIIQRTVRKGRITLCGRLHGVFRTSLTTLTKTGRALLGLVASPANQIKCSKQEAKQRRREFMASTRRRALETVRKMLSEFWGGMSNDESIELPAQSSMSAATCDYMALVQDILKRNGRPPMA